MNSDLINHAFKYVIIATQKYSIDESHSIKHSIDVLTLANNIYKSELIKNQYLSEQYDIICLAAILHDMCDKKYMNESQGITEIRLFMNEYVSETNLDIICKIIQTMSYSTVKKNGYPDMGNYQLAYHIVREADLLAAYDINRCIIYGIMVEKITYTDAIIRSKLLFTNRVLKYIDDNLYITQYSKNLALKLHDESVNNLLTIKVDIV